MSLLIRHADDVDQEQLGEAVLAHDGDGVGAAVVGQLEVAVGLDDADEPVALHAGDGLADGGAALAQPLRNARTQRRDTLLLELKDGAQIHLGGVDEIV